MTNTTREQRTAAMFSYKSATHTRCPYCHGLREISEQMIRDTNAQCHHAGDLDAYVLCQVCDYDYQVSACGERDTIYSPDSHENYAMNLPERLLERAMQCKKIDDELASQVGERQRAERTAARREVREMVRKKINLHWNQVGHTRKQARAEGFQGCDFMCGIDIAIIRRLYLTRPFYE